MMSVVKRYKMSLVLKFGKLWNLFGVKMLVVKMFKVRSGMTGTASSRARATKMREGGEFWIDEEDEYESDKENVRIVMDGGKWGV